MKKLLNSKAFNVALAIVTGIAIVYISVTIYSDIKQTKLDFSEGVQGEVQILNKMIELVENKEDVSKGKVERYAIKININDTNVDIYVEKDKFDSLEIGDAVHVEISDEGSVISNPL